MKRFLLLLLALAWALAAQASEFRRPGQDYRNLAMGNTGIVTATSSSALHYNPAALANIFNWWVEFPMVQVAYSKDAKSLYDVAKNGSFALETQSDQIDFMNDYIGQNPYVQVDAGINLFIPFTQTGWVLGGNYTYEAVLDLAIRNQALPQIEGYVKLDHIRQTGMSIPLGLGKWVLGVTAKRIERQELGFTYDMDDALNQRDFPTLGADGVSGTGTGYDVGLLYRAPSDWRLMYGLVYRQEIDLGDAGTEPGEVALGVASFQDFGAVRWTTAIDWRDLTFQRGAEGDTSLNRRTHIGMEFGFLPLNKSTSMVSLRFGYSQGWPSYGAELALGRAVVLGYTKYTEEVGEWAGHQGNDRTMLFLSLGF